MKYPIGIQNFEKLRTDGYAYVDKTEHIYNLAHQGVYYFLSRPRRFGKSLLLSTMKAYFEGRRELFRGLKLDELEEDWTAYPVLYIDINSGKYKTQGDLDAVLNSHLLNWEKLYGTGDGETTLSLRFSGVIRRAFEKTGRRVVILIDEYDKPLLDTINDEALQDDNRATLKAFYSVLKSQDAYIKFAFLTGVTKFAHVSIFSDLNNLEDVSMRLEYADICGMTESEIRAHFDERIGEMAAKYNITKDECYARLKVMYDGYHFENDTVGIYNPFSVLSALKSCKFDNYWFATGTPTFLVNLLESSDYDLGKLTSRPVTKESLTNIDRMRHDPISVLYQSGYLTISGYDSDSDLYDLAFPNQEVEKGFLRCLVPSVLQRTDSDGVFAINQFRKDVQAGEPEDFMDKLKEFFDSGDYRVAGRAELYFQNSMYIIFRLLGLYTEVETATARGRIDITIKTADYIYIMELKLDGSADEALQQIESKGYADKFAGDKRKLYLIGANFSSESRSIENYRVV